MKSVTEKIDHHSSWLIYNLFWNYTDGIGWKFDSKVYLTEVDNLRIHLVIELRTSSS